MEQSGLNGKQKKVFERVSYLYSNSRRAIAHWFWKNHVTVVAQNALILAKKYQANNDHVFAGALLHDLADVWMERTEVTFEHVSRIRAERILKIAGYSPREIHIIIDDVIAPHSCHPGNIPNTAEGKILATADALAHLITPFYPSLKKMGLPEHINPGNFNEWALSKVERDFTDKIFFDDEREAARVNYNKLRKEFS